MESSRHQHRVGPFHAGRAACRDLPREALRRRAGHRPQPRAAGPTGSTGRHAPAAPSTDRRAAPSFGGLGNNRRGTAGPARPTRISRRTVPLHAGRIGAVVLGCFRSGLEFPLPGRRGARRRRWGRREEGVALGGDGSTGIDRWIACPSYPLICVVEFIWRRCGKRDQNWPVPIHDPDCWPFVDGVPCDRATTCGFDPFGAASGSNDFLN